MGQDLLVLNEVYKHFPLRVGFWQKTIKKVHAVDGVDLRLRRGEVLGVVGETGCGKSTLAQLIMGIYPTTAGSISLNGQDISTIRKSRKVKRCVQMVFQDPFWSLNPRKTVRKILAEPFKVHRIASGKELNGRIENLFSMVGLEPERLDSFPHEFAGGERQLVGIARSIALQPELVILDEPTSAIDTFSQAVILNLLLELRNKFNLSYILISHDLSVVHYLADRVAVMYLGKIVETGKVEDVFNSPCHPYTKALLRAIPVIDPDGKVKPIEPIKGDIPSAIDPKPGCRFAGRCPEVLSICSLEDPSNMEVGEKHFAACHLFKNSSFRSS